MHGYKHHETVGNSLQTDLRLKSPNFKYTVSVIEIWKGIVYATFRDEQVKNKECSQNHIKTVYKAVNLQYQSYCIFTVDITVKHIH